MTSQIGGRATTGLKLAINRGITAAANTVLPGVGGAAVWGAKKLFSKTTAKIAGGIAIALAQVGSIAASVVVTIGIVAVTTPIVIALIIFIINSGAYIVPPATDIFEDGGDDDVVVTEGCPSGWPVASGPITQGPSGTFSHDDNDAIDIGANLGSPVKSTHGGTVYVRHSAGVYGETVQIESICNGITYFSRYSHLVSINSTFTNGKKVSAGTTVGTTGNTGCSPECGVHLHYEFRIGKGNSSDDGSKRAGPAPNNPPYMAMPFIPKNVKYGCVGPQSCNVSIP